MGRGRKAGRHLRGGPRTDEVAEEEGGGKATVQTVLHGLDTCRIGDKSPGPVGSQGGTRLGTEPGPRHGCPPPVGVGGYGWPCP